jgi:hypothetical protein
MEAQKKKQHPTSTIHDEKEDEGLQYMDTSITTDTNVKRVPSPAPLFASSPPSCWTHPARKVSEESSSSTSDDDAMANTLLLVEGEDAHHQSSTWWVEATSQVPLYYPLSPSSDLIEGETVGTVSVRISRCLAQRSIVAMYSGPWAHATTLDGTALTIRLFRGPTSGVIVELQLVRGNPLTFHKLCIILLEAAKGNPHLHLPDHAHPPPSPKKKTQQTQNEHDLIISLEKAYELLEKDRIDANRLGMEMLALLTDSDQPNSDYAAETILLGRDRIGSNIYERVFDLLPLLDLEEDDDRREEMELLRPLAFQVLRNALVTLARGTDLRNLGILLPEWMVESLLPILHTEFSESDPHRAYLAVEAWMALVTLNERAFTHSVQDDQLLTTLERLEAFGLRYHAALAQACQEAILLLQSFQNCKTEKN